MKLLDRYLLREMVVPFLIGQAAIVLLLTGTVLYNNAEILLMNQVRLEYVARMVLYFLPFLIHMTMPVAMAVAASLAVSRLGRDSEITVMRASGASLRRIFAPIFVVGLLISVADFYFGEFAVPYTVRRFEELIGEMALNSPRMNPQAGQWIVSNDQSYALFVKSMIPQKGYVELRGVMIVASPKVLYSGETTPAIVFAKTGRYQGGEWKLEQASLFYKSLDKPDWVVGRGGSFTLNTTVDPQAFKSGFLLQLPMYKFGDAAKDTFTKLGETLKRNRQQGIRDVSATLNYHFKLSVPFSCLVMALCCPPLALRFARGGGFMGTLLSICLVFVYWNTLLLARILGSPGAEGSPPLLSAPVAAWSQNILFVLLGLYVMRKSE